MIIGLEDTFRDYIGVDHAWHLFYFIPNAVLNQTSILHGPSGWALYVLYFMVILIFTGLLAERSVRNRLIQEKNEALKLANTNLNNKIEVVATLSDELRIAKEKAEKMAVTDRLTQLPNRAILDESLYSEINRSQRFGYPFSVIIFDIDHFKQVNDTYGHLIGDEVLKKFAVILKKETRQTDTAGRWGGEEFLVICRETKLEGAQSLAENLRLAIESASFGEAGKLTSSFGVATYTDGDSANILVSRADEALYRAKNAGRNRVETG